MHTASVGMAPKRDSPHFRRADSWKNRAIHRGVGNQQPKAEAASPELRMSHLGLDIGTSGCKAVVFGATGTQLALAYREYTVQYSRDGWAELDAENVCAACRQVIAEAAAAAARDPVRSLGISSQGEAFMPVDASGRILAPAMVSSDTRAASIAKDWAASYGNERLYRITGHTAHPMFTLFKLLWTREHRFDVWRKACHFLCFEDLLHAQLGLEPHIGWPLAGRTMLFDVTAHEWSPEILEAINLDSSRFAEPLPSGSCIGTISRRIAAELGLNDDVAVVTGGHDQMCAALGTGIVSPGQASYATGTVECITAVFEKPKFSSELMAGNLCTYDSAVPGMYGTVAFCLTGGNILQWYRDQFGASLRAEAERTGVNVYELLLGSFPEEPTPLLVLPYFTPSGTPYFDLQTPGVIFGLRLSTTRDEILRALLEGVAYEMRVNTEILARSGVVIREFFATGGGARNARWNQLKADVLGIPIHTIATTESGCCGAALLGASAISGVPVQQLAETWVRPQAVFEPNPRRHTIYSQQFQQYQQLYQAVRSLPDFISSERS
jgi:xylulokinase